MTCLALRSIKDTKVLLPSVEVKAGDRLPVVVVEDDCEVGLRVAVYYPLGLDLAARDSFNDLVSFKFLQRGLDFSVTVEVSDGGCLAAYCIFGWC
jgi:hypothetical protein